MGIKVIEDAIIAKAKAALTVGGQSKVRTVESAPGDWDKDMLKRLLRMVPCVLIVFSGGPAAAAGATVSQITAHWRVIVATGGAGGEAPRRRGDSQEIGAYAILELLVPALDGLLIQNEGTLELADFENLYSGEVDKQGLAVYGLTFTHPMAFSNDVDLSTLTPFATFDAKYDFVPRELYLDLTGAAGKYASTPAIAATSGPGPFEFVVRAALNAWAPAAESVLKARWGVANNNAYKLSALPSGLLRFSYSTDGVNVFNRDSTVAPGFAAGTAHWLKCSVIPNNGLAGHDVKFAKSDDYDPVAKTGTWTAIGATVTTAGAIAIFGGNAALAVGADSAGASPCTGKIFRAMLRNVIDGAAVADFNANDGTPNAVAYASKTTAEVWTLQAGVKIADEIQAEDTVSVPQS